MRNTSNVYFKKKKLFLLKYIFNTLKLIIPLRESIESDYKTALKAKDKNKISTYRLILSGIKDLDINNRSGTEKK